MKFIILLLFTLSFGPLDAHALQVWRHTDGGVQFIFPELSHVQERYFQGINQSPDLRDLRERPKLMDLLHGDQLPYQRGVLSTFPRHPNTAPKFLVVTNDFRELYGPPYNSRAQNIHRRLGQLGAEVYFLPPVHDIALTSAQRESFHQSLGQHFDALLIMGGDDITPQLYGETTTFARGTNLLRDQSELRFVRHFMAQEQGMTFGICRGHQMCAVAAGNGLIQDVQIERYADHIHLDGHHPIRVDPTSTFFLDSAIADRPVTLEVNSLHHQAVLVSDYDPHFRVTAYSLDQRPLVEAMELRNGLGASFQFHPELMDDELGQQIMRRMVELAGLQKARRMDCRQLLEAIVP